MADGITGGSGNPSGFLASERFDFDAYYEENPAALDQDLQKTKDEIKTQVMFDNMGQGSGQFGGLAFGIVGIAVGAIYGLVDGIAFDAAIDASIEEAKERRENIERDIEEVMNFRADIENKMAQYTTPMEQALRERAKAHGLGLRAQGISGPQLIAAQLTAERQYRETVGPNITRAIGEASTAARADAMARLQAVESKYGIILNQQRAELLQSQQVAQLKAGQQSSIQGGIGAIAGAFGTLIDEAIDQNQSQGPTETGQGSTETGQDQPPPAEEDPFEMPDQATGGPSGMENIA